MSPREPSNYELMTEIKLIKKILCGDPEKRDDLGLVGAVHDNTKFRDTFSKLAWLIIVAVFGTWGTIVAQVVLSSN